MLRFNEDTRQSVARVIVTKDLQSGETSVMQRSDCMAFLYMKTLAAAGLIRPMLAQDMILEGN